MGEQLCAIYCWRGVHVLSKVATGDATFEKPSTSCRFTGRGRQKSLAEWTSASIAFGLEQKSEGRGISTSSGLLCILSSMSGNGVDGTTYICKKTVYYAECAHSPLRISDNLFQPLSLSLRSASGSSFCSRVS